MKRLQVCFVLFIILLLIGNLFSQDRPSLIGQGAGKYLSTKLAIIYDQMDNPGTNSITSQNFETVNDIFDSFAADDFALMDMTYNVESIDVIGAYYNGSGPATSVNVWFYTCNGSGGLPTDIVYSALYIIPSAGLTDGSFSIPLPVPAVLNEGWYWLCVQANMDYSSGGQWGWTGRTVQSWSESAWKNPGGGFGTICTPSWGYRVTDCAVGSDSDNCFRLNGYITPVELISFTAETSDKGVALNWSTATETNNQGFEVERASYSTTPVQGWENIGYVPGYGTTTEPKSYSYTDSEVSAGKYIYRLKQVDFDGSYEYSHEVEVDVIAPLEFELEQNYPNPFNPSTVISYQLPVNSDVTLKVYDIIGNEIAKLVDEYKLVGKYEVAFSIYSDEDRNLSSGVYFYQLKAGEFIITKKMILLR